MKTFLRFAKSSSWCKILAIYALLSFILRTFLLFKQKADIDFSILQVAEIYCLGLFFDTTTILYMSFIPLTYHTFVSEKFFNSEKHQKVNRVLYFSFLYLLIFGCFAEVTFWDEFQTRFNFIAVDYLVYTGEVIGNIAESYPLTKILGVIFVLTCLIFYPTQKKIVMRKIQTKTSKIISYKALALALAASFFLVSSENLTKNLTNNFSAEIAKNGVYQLFSAYRNNEINYQQLYETRSHEITLKELRHSISKQEPNSNFLSEDSIARQIKAPRPGSEIKANVMFVTIESLSADFMKSFENENNITPNLDSLAKKGLFFTNLYATGTRTVRGLEALSLSVPPTPGNSIVRRPNNENLFNISSPLNERGYESKFIYGGFGYFDNMNYFFSNNGFQIVDRENFTSNEITFSNAWGVSDEDLYAKAIKEADQSYANKKPFLNFIMTTSNHRPFTYPDGRIDIPSKTGRDGAVKYTDYEIGRFLEMAKTKPWFDNTIFVFVADHCAGSAGNSELPLWRYQIPAIFYAPKIIKPQKVTQIASQIDIAPTLFGAMNLSYKSKFFGTDVINNGKNMDRHVFISTYSEVGYFEDGKLYVLKPKKRRKFFDVQLLKHGWNGSKEIESSIYEDEELNEVIAYYQSASEMFKNGAMKNFDQKPHGAKLKN